MSDMCKGCIQGKQTWNVSHTQENQATTSVDLLHADLISSISSIRYNRH